MGAAPAVPGQIQTGCEATFLYREVVKHRDRLPGEVVDAPRLSVFGDCPPLRTLLISPAVVR